MSQAPSVAFAAIHEDSLVGAPASVSVASPHGSPTQDVVADGGRGRVPEADRHKESVSLRGTTRGLEILITGTPSTAVLGARLTELLAEAPSFFAGSNARVAFEGALPSGALACLEEVATRFELQIVEISPLAVKRRRAEVPVALRPEDVRQVKLAEGTGPLADDVVEVRSFETGSADAARPALPSAAMPSAAALSGGMTSGAVSSSAVPSGEVPSAAVPSGAVPSAAVPSSATTSGAMPSGAAPSAAVPSGAVPAAAMASAAEPSAATAVPSAATASAAMASAAAALAAELTQAVPPGPRLVIGPVRSGTIVDHPGHVIVIGDVNPCAEIRAEGSIIVLGRMRGVAHAAIGRAAGFIVALSLQPQQLRIGRMVARAADADRPSDGAEIAYATGETIVVERFLGRLPSGLAASM